MNLLIVGLVVFLGVHSVSIVAPRWRDAMARRLGEWPWKALYGAVAIAGFVAIVQGWSAARVDPVVWWVPPAWSRHATMALMLPVFPLALAAYLPGRIGTAARHPLLAATQLWALAHLLSHGHAHEVLLFGGFLAWAVADRLSLQRRAPRAVPQLPRSRVNDLLVLVGGLALYAFFVLRGHALLIGLPLMPAA